MLFIKMNREKKKNKCFCSNGKLSHLAAAHDWPSAEWKIKRKKTFEWITSKQMDCFDKIRHNIRQNQKKLAAFMNEEKKRKRRKTQFHGQHSIQ